LPPPHPAAASAREPSRPTTSRSNFFLLTSALLYWYIPGRTKTLGRTANQMH
jgi:hypothetical protein